MLSITLFGCRQTKHLGFRFVVIRSTPRRFVSNRPGHKEEYSHPNLGFDPSILEGKPFSKHDHPKRPASEYISQIPPVVVDGRVAACGGGDGPLGHPLIFINLDPSTPEDPTPCGYCGLRFVQKSHVPPGHPLLADLPETEE